ncbi:hydroxyacylglutathione hydrolase [Cupriavidus pinatubonensis]|uniref:Hydroxyacylglutathione hydrolase n=1 Tax=Cupriavidus pinatubonensis TaxID=248026 RepID=A0ABM8XLH1_9BURK|nr:hydroxyacylglutathione hydrolase [Cupriavidus pinatubonensis]CAG9181080.1 Hydroxyacylglutathione hydrolase GloB [Cupriavidus pinatubonensis]
MLTLLPLPAFSDNYIWLLHDGCQAWVVDPGDAAVVRDYLQRLGLSLQGILLTHHHPDHTGGVGALRRQTGAAVHGPHGEPLPEPVKRLREGDRLDILGCRFEVLEVPGHTAGHIAYFSKDSADAPILFCGDTLFSAGCGRLFEGTPAQMLASLDKLAALPPRTRVCPAHEYTLGNLRFAQAVEPGNQDVAAYLRRCIALRAGGEPTLPSRLACELRVNPFLRSREPAVRHALRARLSDGADDVQVFAALREWKNDFR